MMMCEGQHRPSEEATDCIVVEPNNVVLVLNMQI